MSLQPAIVRQDTSYKWVDLLHHSHSLQHTNLKQMFSQNRKHHNKEDLLLRCCKQGFLPDLPDFLLLQYIHHSRKGDTMKKLYPIPYLQDIGYKKEGYSRH
ncbi:MAG: hypothetical protein WAZ40_02130 [Minisyncoccia bacterium]